MTIPGGWATLAAAMPRVLILSPDEELLEALCERVAFCGSTPLPVQTLEDARTVLGRGTADVVCMDWDYKQDDLAELRQWLGRVGRGDRSPVILMVSPLAALVPELLPPFLEPDRDHVIAKPVETDAFDDALVHALASETLRFGRFALDARPLPLSREAALDESASVESRLLDHLLRHAGTVVSSAELMGIMGTNAGAGEEDLRRHISRLRQRLRQQGDSAPRLRTVAGRGYKLIV